MKNNRGFICAAYGCHASIDEHKIIHGKQYGFCKDHIGILDNGSTMTLLEVIGNTKQDIIGLKNMINFDKIGYSESEFHNTIQFLFSLGEIEHDGSILVTRESKTSCKFHGCKLKRRDGSQYCSNHKNLPAIETIDAILDCIKFLPKPAKQIGREVNIKSDKIKTALHQLLKFGYVIKEKRGVTNYYMCR